jgi:hypothetical protein
VVAIRCPKCDLPLTRGESMSGACPICNSSLPPVPRPVTDQRDKLVFELQKLPGKCRAAGAIWITLGILI